MPTLEFVGQSARDSDFEMAQSSRLVNYYREPIPGAGQARYALKSVLGTASFADLGKLLLRRIGVVSGTLYAVAADTLYSVTTAGAATEIGTTTVGANCTIAGNNGVVTVAGGGKYYTWDGTTLAEPTAGAFSSFGSVTFLGNYTVLTEYNGRRFQWSDLADPDTLDALNFATAEGRDGDLIRGEAISGNLWLFKSDSHEIWTLTGQGGASAFSRLAGGVRDVGLKAYSLFTRFDGGAFFVGDEGTCYIIAGGRLQPVSLPAVESAIAAETPTNCFYYEDEGHKFCVVRFENRPAWVYDIATGEWHERAEGTDFGAWGALDSANFNGSWRVGTIFGVITTLTRNNADTTGEMRRTAVSRTLYGDGQRFSVRELEFRGRFGKPNLGREAKAFVRISRDNGLTWGQPMDVHLGDQGEYRSRAILRRLGADRQFTVEWNMSDETDFSVLADARVEVV
jgi:hypothetical protein